MWLTCLTKSRLIFKDTPSQDDVLNVLFNCFYQSVSLVLSISVVGYHFSLEVKIKIKKRTRVKNQLRLLSYLLNKMFENQILLSHILYAFRDLHTFYYTWIYQNLVFFCWFKKNVSRCLSEPIISTFLNLKPIYKTFLQENIFS